MNDDFHDKKEKQEGYEQQEVYSKAVRAGKRTYFFDVKSNRKNDYFLTITESKKRFHKDGRFYFEKHKIYLYKEDFEKFSDGFTDVVNYISNITSNGVELNADHDPSVNDYTAVDFDDLEKVETDSKDAQSD